MRPDDIEFARLAAALGNPARLAIVRFLFQNGACICGEIVNVLPLAQSTVSQHLKTLKEAGWIDGQIDGSRICYSLNAQAIKQFSSFWAQAFELPLHHDSQIDKPNVETPKTKMPKTEIAKAKTLKVKAAKLKKKKSIARKTTDYAR